MTQSMESQAEKDAWFVSRLLAYAQTAGDQVIDGNLFEVSRLIDRFRQQGGHIPDAALDAAQGTFQLCAARGLQLANRSPTVCIEVLDILRSQLANERRRDDSDTLPMARRDWLAPTDPADNRIFGASEYDGGYGLEP